MLKTIVRLTVVPLALVGLAKVVVFALPFVSGAGAPDYVSYLPSPDGSMKVATSTWEGGGAISPYCNVRVTVVPADATPAAASAEAMTVFEGECGTFGVENGVAENSPNAVWQDARTLKVFVSIADTVPAAASIKLRRQDASGRVAVTFDVSN